MDHTIPRAYQTQMRIALLIIALLVLALGSMGYMLYELSNDIQALTDYVERQEARLSGVEADMQYVIPLAENANLWAHSHPW